MKTAALRTSWLTCTRVSPSAKAPTSAVTSGTSSSRAKTSARAGWALPIFTGVSGVRAPEIPDAKVQPAERGADHGHLARFGQVGRHLLHMADELLQFP